MKFVPWDTRSRVFQVTGASAPLVCQVTYFRYGDAYAGKAMDCEVLPLIMAAPDLLAALKKAVEVMKDNEIDTQLSGEFEALFEGVIAKAEGRAE